MFSQESDETLYSYGNHFAICSHIRGADHNGYELLFTTRGYSNSTSKHLSHARSATSHLKTLFCHDPKLAKRGKHADNLGSYMREAIDNVNAYRGRDTRADHYRLEDATHNLEMFGEYKTAFKLTYKQIEIIAPDALKTYRKLTKGKNAFKHLAKEMGAKHQKAVKQARAESERLAKLQADEALPVWLATGKPHFSLRKQTVALRLDLQGRVQTSHQATVPALSALKIWKLAQRARKTSQAIEANGEKIGHYKLTKIDEHGNATIGCHHIPFDVMANFAPQLIASLETSKQDSHV